MTKSASENCTVLRDNLSATLLRIGTEMVGVLFVWSETSIQNDDKLLDMYANQVVNMIQTSKLFEELEHRNVELNQKPPAAT